MVARSLDSLLAWAHIEDVHGSLGNELMPAPPRHDKERALGQGRSSGRIPIQDFDLNTAIENEEKLIAIVVPLPG